jgi:hypothetical protein
MPGSLSWISMAAANSAPVLTGFPIVSVFVQSQLAACSMQNILPFPNARDTGTTPATDNHRARFGQLINERTDAPE